MPTPRPRVLAVIRQQRPLNRQIHASSLPKKFMLTAAAIHRGSGSVCAVSLVPHTCCSSSGSSTHVLCRSNTTRASRCFVCKLPQSHQTRIPARANLASMSRCVSRIETSRCGNASHTFIRPNNAPVITRKNGVVSRRGHRLNGG